jgi:multicomponent Na+:H+ antiporter subunit B
MKKDFSNTLKQWYNGELNLDKEISQGKEPVAPTEVITPKKKIEIIPSIEKKELQLSSKLYKTLGVVFCIILSIFLIGVVNFLPLFARSNTPTDNEVSHHYVADGRDETGAVNTVAGMILDYRAFDTLGESFVLFTATCAVLLLLEQSENNEKKESNKKENFLYKHDVIVCTIVKILIPITFVFGVYILFNGHLSPGGGFSGGAILGAALILFAMAFGEEKASKVFTPKIIKIVTIASLSFYCLAKSYSFFTGNEFNGLHSIISSGTPGNFLSGGLILPLNIAVGCVVCCTMYSFYMLFKRGRLD